MGVRTCFLDENTIEFNAVSESELTSVFKAKQFIFLTCFWHCTRKNKIKYYRKFIFMIDEWKNPLKDPFFFVQLDHIDSYNPSDYCSNQGCALFVLVYNLFLLFLISICLRFFPLVLSKSLSNCIGLLIPCTGTFNIILERGGRSGGLFMYLIRSHSQPYASFCISGSSLCGTLPWYLFLSSIAPST